MSGLVDKIKHAVHPTVSPASLHSLAEVLLADLPKLAQKQGTKTVDEVDNDKHKKTHSHEVEEDRADTLASESCFSLTFEIVSTD